MCWNVESLLSCNGIVLGMQRIPARCMFKGGVRVQVCSSSTTCQHWYVWWHGDSMYGLHQRKMSKRFMQIFSSAITFTRKSKSCSTATDIVTIGMWHYIVNIISMSYTSFGIEDFLLFKLHVWLQIFLTFYPGLAC